MNTVQVLENVLRNIFYLKDIPYSLSEFASMFSMISFEKDETIVAEGEPGSCIYVLMSGKVLLSNKPSNSQDAVLQTLHSPNTFGEINLLENGKWLFTAKALDDVILYSMERSLFFEFLHSNPPVFDSLLSNLGVKIRQLEIRNMVLNNINTKLSNSPKEQEHNTPNEPPAKSTTKANNAVPAPGKAPASGINQVSAAEEQPAQEGNLAKRLEKILAATVRDNVHKEVETSKEMLYNKKTVCPLCQRSFESPKVLSKYIKVEKIDQDFCKHHRYADPLYYEVYVCPKCGFAYNDDIQNIRFKKETAETVSAQLSAFWGGDKVKDYCLERSLDDALETFLLAIYCLGNRPIKKSQLSMLHLKTAWLYRHKGDIDLENEYLNNSLENLAVSFEKESFTSTKGEINALYLLGVLSFKTGNFQGAAGWLERVLRHQARTAFPLIINQARDIWAEVRSTMREDKDNA